LASWQPARSVSAHGARSRARHPVPLAHARVGHRRCSVNRAAHARSMPSVLRFPRNRMTPTCRPTDGLSGRTSVRAVATCPPPKHILGTTEQPSPTATTLFIGSTLSNSINGFGGGPACASHSPTVRRSADPSLTRISGQRERNAASPFSVSSSSRRAEWRRAHPRTTRSPRTPDPRRVGHTAPGRARSS